jgi:hypothetical protein
MASSRGFLNIQSLNELTYENKLTVDDEGPWSLDRGASVCKFDRLNSGRKSVSRNVALDDRLIWAQRKASSWARDGELLFSHKLFS